MRGCSGSADASRDPCALVLELVVGEIVTRHSYDQSAQGASNLRSIPRDSGRRCEGEAFGVEGAEEMTSAHAVSIDLRWVPV